MGWQMDECAVSDGCLYWLWCEDGGGLEWFDFASRHWCGRSFVDERVCTACPARIDRLLAAQ